ncbi:MAG: hypothetical protein ONB46_00620 [candidate division KSB1 bacterium]|nr:hypothetical protein [candidate division KSB1 bacterium]MDZ7364652.1 hypothetical protein [candidate division KSB1 bacterium]MDZ7402600.1 hypothetical protein [candidate division KSB1 bacterium]
MLWVFVIKKSPADFGWAKCVGVAENYTELEIGKGLRLVPLNLLVLEVE